MSATDNRAVAKTVKGRGREARKEGMGEWRVQGKAREHKVEGERERKEGEGSMNYVFYTRDS